MYIDAAFVGNPTTRNSESSSTIACAAESVPSWGNLAADGLSQLNTVNSRWWLLLWPCLMIAMTLVVINYAGQHLRFKVDPKHA